MAKPWTRFFLPDFVTISDNLERGQNLKESSKYLLMAAASIVQDLDDMSAAAAGMDVQGEKFDSEYFFTALSGGLHTLLNTLKGVADEEEADISAAYIAGHP